MKKINFVNGTTIDGASTFNEIQDNIENVFNGNEPMGSIVVDDISCKNKFNKYGSLTDYIEWSSGTTTLESNGKIKATANIINGNGKGQIIQLKSNTTYTYSIKIDSAEVSGSTLFRILKVNSDGSATTRILDETVIASAGKTYSYQFATGDTGKIWLTLNGITNSDYTIFKYVIYDEIQIEEGTVATEYTPYKNFEGRQDIITGQECPTNEYVDGKRVYVKRINLGKLPNASFIKVSTGLTMADITITKPISGTARTDDGATRPLPYVDIWNNSYSTTINIDKQGDLLFYSDLDWSYYTGYINLYYTKNDTSPAMMYSPRPTTGEATILEETNTEPVSPDENEVI